ncbi:hypothetical protein ACIVBQ_000941 [Tenacibaculum discolor]
MYSNYFGFLKNTIVFILLFVAGVTYTQDIDSLSTSKTSRGFPQLRKFNISYSYRAPNRYDANFKGQPKETGKVARNEFLAYGTFKLFDKKKYTLSLTQSYAHLDLDPDQFSNLTFFDEDIYKFDNYSTSLNFTYKSRLFGKPFIGNATITGSTRNFSHIDKLSGYISGMLIFQRNQNTRYTLGLIARADPSSKIPVFPLVTYWHRFKNPLYELSVIIPKELKLRRSETFGGWLGIGSDFNAQSYFIPNIPNRDGTYENRFNDIQFGLSYDHIFMKHFMFSVNTGYNKVIQNNIIEVYKPNNEKLADISYKGNWYARVGVSYLFEW